MVVNTLYYYLYRGECCHSNNELIEGIIEDIKNYVFDERGITLSSQGYSGIPLQGETPLESKSDDLWKIIDILFKISVDFEDLVFQIETTIVSDNPFFCEAERNEVLPKWVKTPEDFTQRVYGFDGVLHTVSPEMNAKFPTLSDIEIVRTKSRETRNILVTEAVKQRLMVGASRNFGMQKTSVYLPMELAYIARQRPELLSAAIREYTAMGEDKDCAEQCLSESERVMVHVYLNATDWQTVTALADIEMPRDIVSHRVSRALMAFDRRHSSIHNGIYVPDDSQLFKNVTDCFERERLNFLFSTLFKTPNSLTHTYQVAKLSLSEKHLTECRKLFKDDMCSSSENRNSTYSDNDEYESKTRNSKRHVYKKKRRDLGKKRMLAPVVTKVDAQAPSEVEEASLTVNYDKLRQFERVVNGDDIYKESSEENSLGEEELDVDFFIRKPISKSKKVSLQVVTAHHFTLVSDEDGSFDVSEVVNPFPPIAIEEEDFDDI